MRQGIDILKANGGGGRLRVGILMTDGVDSSDPASLVGEAVDESIAIYTIGLGSVDETKLRGLAEGTGGTYQHLTSADQLPQLYGELVRDLIDDGTDTDGDTLTDCEERNGLFSPAMLWLPALGTNRPLDDIGEFSFPNPEMRDTDLDQTPDGVEARRVRFADNPDVARAFQVMVDAGRDTYFLLTTGRPDRWDTDNDELADPVFPQRSENCRGEDFGTSPFAWDSDSDDLSDSVECANGTDPLEPNVDDYGVPGLIPFTLFTPVRYQGDDDPVVPYIFEPDDDTLRRLRGNSVPIYYDEDYNCVEDLFDQSCDALVAWAAERGDSNGFGVCVWGRGNCVDDASQIRDKIRGIAEQQGVFKSNGQLRAQYVGANAWYICAGSFSDSGPCHVDVFFLAALGVAPDVAPSQLAASTTGTLKETIDERVKTPNIGRIIEVARVLSTLATLYRNLSRDDREEAITRILEQCYASDVLDVVDYLEDELHPCEAMPIFAPGEDDAGGAARNDAAAIAADTSKITLSYVPAAERDPIVQQALAADGNPTGEPRRWYRRYEPCVSYDTNLYQCDEYPFYSSSRGGPPTVATDPLGSRIDPVPIAENKAEGDAYGAFTRACPRVAAREPFLVVPMVGPAAAPTDWVCPP